ncbi:MAG: hypothetical protein KF842_07880 [Caulobacter sp.]|nr:hypothetical protein [Caulobacter sp.]
MSETPRCSIDSRYEREGAPHDAGHETPVATPVPYAPPQSVTVGVPGAPVTYTSPAGAVTAGGVYSPVGSSVVVGQQPVGLPVSSVTVINNPPPAGSPCPVCGKPLGEPAANKAHAHHGPAPAPRFSKATPEVFRDGFKPLWDAAQAEQAAYVVVSGCNKLMGVLLKELEAKAKADKDPGERGRSGGGLFGWGKPQEKKPTFAERIEKLQKKGLLLRSTVNAARDSGMTEVLTEKIDASAVTSEMAQRYVQLLWQVADQGFEQPGWSQSGAFPKAVAGPPEDHAHAAPHATHAGGGHADSHGH